MPLWDYREYRKRTAWLLKHLGKAIETSTLSYEEICNINTVGLYFIYTETEDSEIEF